MSGNIYRRTPSEFQTCELFISRVDEVFDNVYIYTCFSDIMGKLSELFGRQEGYSVDPEKRRLDDELLNEHLDQEWRQKYIAPEVGSHNEIGRRKCLAKLKLSRNSNEFYQ